MVQVVDDDKGILVPGSAFVPVDHDRQHRRGVSAGNRHPSRFASAEVSCAAAEPGQKLLRGQHPGAFRMTHAGVILVFMVTRKMRAAAATTRTGKMIFRMFTSFSVPGFQLVGDLFQGRFGGHEPCIDRFVETAHVFDLQVGIQAGAGSATSGGFRARRLAVSMAAGISKAFMNISKARGRFFPLMTSLARSIRESVHRNFAVRRRGHVDRQNRGVGHGTDHVHRQVVQQSPVDQVSVPVLFRTDDARNAAGPPQGRSRGPSERTTSFPS